jgi:putative oxidoreductase
MRRDAGIASLLVRVVAGVVFVSFGVGKFSSHASELASFRAYGLPWPDAFVYLIGVVELAGGLLLIAGLAARPVSLLLAANMVGAIVVSGLGRGETISLTLAPALLLAMLFLAARGPGRWSLPLRR